MESEIGNTWKMETMLMQICYAAISSDDMSRVNMENIWYDRCIQYPIKRLFRESQS